MLSSTVHLHSLARSRLPSAQPFSTSALHCLCLLLLLAVAEKLYVEEIDVGEERPRQVVSGLVDFVPLSDFQSARLCVICNLKPSALRGITSYGMVLAASNAEHSVVELITPPAAAAVGTRLRLSTLDVTQWTPDAVVDPKKKGGVWEKVKPGLRTDAQGRATYEGAVWMAGDGDCTSQTLKDAPIS
jgi:tRNA-binding EMAP/Myf-like protein